MLVHLDASAIRDAIGAGETAARSQQCIDTLLLLHHEGHHLLSVTPEEIGKLVHLAPKLSPRARGALRRIESDALQILGLRSRLRWHLELGVGPAYDGRAHARVDARRVIRGALHDFDRVTRAGRATLMGENLTDIDFFVELARLALSLGRQGRITTSYEKVPGGGSTFAPLFADRADEGRILLAIADSDRQEPGGSAGETWRELEKKLKKDGQDRPHYQRARCLPVRETENLIPPDVYDAVFTHGGKKDARVRAVEKLRRSSTADRAHADVKSQLGSKVLAQVVDWIRRERPARSAEIASLFGLATDEALAELCAEIIAWGCAFPEMLT